MVLILLFIISLSVIFPSSFFGGLQCWFCGTCTKCHSCPPCEPHLNFSPKCECQNNLNNCNYECLTSQKVQDYHNSWNRQQTSNQHNMHKAQMNSNNLKRHLLGWIIGLSSFNIILLCLIAVLILCAPTLVRRCSKWQSSMKLKRQARLIEKFNLVKRSALHSVKPSYDELLKKLAEQKQQLEHLTRDSPATNSSSLSPSKIF